MKIHIVLGAPTNNQKISINSEEEDVFIGVDRGAYYIKEAGYPLNLALGDFDSLSRSELEEIQTYAEDILYKSDQDNTDFEWTLLQVSERYNDRPLLIHNWMGGRLDHLLNILYIFYQSRFAHLIPNVCFTHPDQSVTFYEPGNYTLTKELDKTYLSFVVMKPINSLTLKDVKYPLSDEEISTPVSLISNEFLNKEMTLSFDSGLMMVVQSKDA